MSDNFPVALMIGEEPVRYGLTRPGPEGATFRTHFNSAFRKALSSKQKIGLPRFDFWKHNTGRVFGVVADFDALPPGFEDWDGFRAYLSVVCPNGVVIHSASGKAKVVFKVELPEDDHYSYTMTNLIAQDTLRHQLGELYPYIDHAPVSAHVCFVNSLGYDELLSGLMQRPNIDAIMDSWVPPVSHDWNWIPETYVRELSDLRDTLDETQFYIVRFIASWAKKGLDSIQLPQTFLADQSRLLYETGQASRYHTQSQISIAIRELIEMGLLTCINPSYRIGHYSKTYSVTTYLRLVLCRIIVQLRKDRNQLADVPVNPYGVHPSIIKEKVEPDTTIINSENYSTTIINSENYSTTIINREDHYSTPPIVPCSSVDSFTPPCIVPGSKSTLRVNSLNSRDRAALKAPQELYWEPIVFSRQLPAWITDRVIADGAWHSTLWRATNFFRSEGEFMAWVRSIPGFELKTRLKQAIRAWKSHTDRATPIPFTCMG